MLSLLLYKHFFVTARKLPRLNTTTQAAVMNRCTSVLYLINCYETFEKQNFVQIAFQTLSNVDALKIRFNTVMWATYRSTAHFVTCCWRTGEKRFSIGETSCCVLLHISVDWLVLRPPGFFITQFLWPQVFSLRSRERWDSFPQLCGA